MRHRLQEIAGTGDIDSPATAGTRMRAIVQDAYGEDAADVLRLEEIDRPEGGDADVLVRVRAASVHIGDWHLMTGLPYVIRAMGFGLRRPRARVRGADVAGTVEAVGKGVTRFRAGDEVFGTCDGSLAEYATAREETLAAKPAEPLVAAPQERWSMELFIGVWLLVKVLQRPQADFLERFVVVP